MEAIYLKKDQRNNLTQTGINVVIQNFYRYLKGSSKKKRKILIMIGVIWILNDDDSKVIGDTFEKLEKELRERITRGMGQVIIFLGVTHLYTVYTLYTLGLSLELNELLLWEHNRLQLVYTFLYALYTLYTLRDKDITTTRICTHCTLYWEHNEL